MTERHFVIAGGLTLPQAHPIEKSLARFFAGDRTAICELIVAHQRTGSLRYFRSFYHRHVQNSRISTGPKLLLRYPGGRREQMESAT